MPEKTRDENIELTPYDLAIRGLEERREQLRSQIYKISSDIAQVIEQNDRSLGIHKAREIIRNREIVRELRAYPYYYNPPELKLLSEKNKSIGELYPQKLKLEDDLGLIEEKIRAF